VTPAAPPRPKIPWYAYIAPAIPVVMVIAFKWPMIPAFILGTIYALLSTQFGKRTLRESVDLFHKTFYDAFPDITTIAALYEYFSAEDESLVCPVYYDRHHRREPKRLPRTWPARLPAVAPVSTR
jgi:hypothetical protein